MEIHDERSHSPAGKASSPPVTHDESANLPGSPADMNGKEEKQDVEMKGSEPRDKLKDVDENSKSRDIKYDPFSDDDEDISHSDKDQGRKKRSSRRKSSEKEPEKDPVRAVDESSQDSTSKKEKASWKDEMISKHPKLVDLVKYWKPVKADPSDFQGWTYLLQYVDQENDVEAAQEVYDSFLSRYPYCYGYWKKYADYMKKKAMKKDCEMVFNKGLKAIPLSVDLWLHYLNYCKAHHAPRESFVRDTFEDAINTCGLEFRSDRLWELYINWELEKDRLDRVFAIYDRLIRIPTQFHKTHWENFEDLVKQHNPKELLLPSELLSFRMSLHDEKKLLAETEGDAPPGDEAEAPGSDTSKKMTDEEIDAIKRKIRESRKEVHKKTETMISERFAFEEAIKRPYFHVKPLERGQLKNWREYLDFEISFRGYLGDEERIRILFERCLIACALYEEFWIKYAKYTETKDTYKVDYTRSIYDRACNIHLQKRPGIHLQWAAFEEKHGNEEKSAEILNKMVGLFPSLEIVLLRRINLERRRGHLNSALAFYKKAIITAGSTSTGSNLSIRAARFASKVLGNASEAEEILSTAVEKDPKNPRLYLQLTDLYMHQVPFDFTAVLKALNKALSAPLDLQDKLRFAQRKLQFVEDFAPFVTDLHEAEKEYSDLAREVREKMPKREAEPQSLKGEPDTKKAREAYTPALPTTAYSTSAATPYTSASYTNQYNYGSSYGTNYAGSTYNPATYQQGSTWYNQGSYGYGYGNYPYTGY